MWQTMYDLHRLRMRELEAEADRRRRWALEDDWNGRETRADLGESRARARAASAAAGLSRAAARFAVWLDCRVVVEQREDRILRDA
jgi:hypothetical protein